MSELDNGIGIPFEEILDAVRRHGVQPWFLHVYRARPLLWEATSICEWVTGNIAKDAAILSAGCGMAFNLFWLARQGYENLHGFDIDPKAIGAATELAARHGFDVTLWTGNLGDDNPDCHGRYDYIEAMNCLMYEEGMYPRFFAAFSKALKPGGYLAFDVIDESYNAVPNNQWLTSDWGKAVEDRGPSEYKTRYSLAQVMQMAGDCGLTGVISITKPQTVPRILYIFRKPEE